jgi:hypothetical protein
MNDNNQNKNMLRAKFLQTGEIIFSENKKGVSYPQAIKKEIKTNIFTKNKDAILDDESESSTKEVKKVGFFKKLFSAIWRLIKGIILIIVITVIIVIVYENYLK